MGATALPRRVRAATAPRARRGHPAFRAPGVCCSRSGERGRAGGPPRREGKGPPLPAATPAPRGPAPRCGRGGLTFLAAEGRVPGQREEGAQAEEQQRQEGAIAEPHLPGCAAGAGGAEAAWPGSGAGGPEAAGPRPRDGRGGARAGGWTAPPGAGAGPSSAGRRRLHWAAERGPAWIPARIGARGGAARLKGAAARPPPAPEAGRRVRPAGEAGPPPAARRLLSADRPLLGPRPGPGGGGAGAAGPGAQSRRTPRRPQRRPRAADEGAGQRRSCW